MNLTPKVKLIIALVITIISLVLVLEYRPNVGWFGARLGCLIYACIFGYFTYSGTQYKAGVGEAKLQYDDVKNSLKTKGWNDFDKTIGKAPFWLWLGVWILFTQIMVSFYIADY